MKILFLIRRLHCAGAERQLVVLARGLRGRGHEVAVAVFYPGGPLESELRESGVQVYSLDKRGRWDVCGFTWRLIRLIRRECPVILHGYLCVPNILSGVLSMIFPAVRVIWGVRSSNMDLSKYDWLHRVLYILECRLSNVADLIIANSEAGLDYAAAHGFPRVRMLVIPNGIDTERFRPDSEARQRVRAEWRIDADQKLVGLVARLDPMKDHPTFLKAASLLAKEREDLVFVCVGDGPEAYTRDLMEMSEQLGLATRVIWTGSRADLPAVYNALDLLVSSSVSEGFPNVIGEAMACGLPCVATDVGDSRLIVGNHSEIVPPRDAEALKLAIAKCLSRPNRDGSEAHFRRQRIVERFSIRELEVRTETALLQVCKSH